MSPIITSVAQGSPAAKMGIQQGDVLELINGNDIRDVLDYKFYSYESYMALRIKRDGQHFWLCFKKQEGQDIGLSFESYLMDEQKTCSNRCVFCFIDQLPRGMRSTLYYKDDDARLSFLTGNYISMTNLSEQDIERIIKMRVSPLNISVHTTDKQLRSLMLGNERGGQTLDYLYKLASEGIEIKAQIVVCPGLNDGEHFSKTLSDLSALSPAVSSVAIVPVGLTKHREGLYPLSAMTADSATAVIEQIDAQREQNIERTGNAICYAADEFYLLAKKPMPQAEYYGDYPQLENGVGLMSLLSSELTAALLDFEPSAQPAPLAIACGRAAQEFIAEMIDKIKQKCGDFDCTVYGIDNDFFGRTVDVSGLVTGGDIAAQLKGKISANRLLLPSVMLRHRENVFLDDVTLKQLSETLDVQVTSVENDGFAFLDAVMGGSSH